MKSLILILTIIISCATAVQAQKQLATDSVYLFTDKNGTLVLKSQRQVSPKYMQITNFTGRSVLLKISIDLKAWASFNLKSPEKKVFACPEGINQLYLIIDPDNPNAVKTVINRNEKYELFYNKSIKLYDIMKIVIME